MHEEITCLTPDGFEPIHPDDEERVMAEFAHLIDDPESRRSVAFRYRRPDGDWIWAEARGRNLLEHPVVEGVVVYTRDVTDRKERERALEASERRFRAVFEEAFDAIAADDGEYADVNAAACELFGLPEAELLGPFTSAVSHDLRNPLAVLDGALRLAEETGDPEHYEADGTIGAAPSRFHRLLENLLRNAVEHGSTNPASQARQDADGASSVEPSIASATEDAVEHGGEEVTVTVDTLDDGFYVADDGPGIPSADRDRVFEAGYSTNAEGTGLGMAIVEEIAGAHGWTVRVTESGAGGARVDVTGVEFVDE